MTFTYDKLGRLVQVTYSDGTTVVYTYDDNGNRTSVVITTP
jgi:YD repeat-containing protein